MKPFKEDRVRRHTPRRINSAIDRQVEQEVMRYAKRPPEEITGRIHELRQEWDIERTLEANASAVALLGISLGAFVNRKWFALPAVVAGFLLQHAIQGWCPPLPLFRRLGVRSRQEIDEEVYALKALRGDFQTGKNEGPLKRTWSIIQAARS